MEANVCQFQVQRDTIYIVRIITAEGDEMKHFWIENQKIFTWGIWAKWAALFGTEYDTSSVLSLPRGSSDGLWPSKLNIGLEVLGPVHASETFGENRQHFWHRICHIVSALSPERLIGWALAEQAEGLFGSLEGHCSESRFLEFVGEFVRLTGYLVGVHHDSKR